MGGAVSSGRDNTELIDNLMGGNYIRSRDVERVFRALDRGDYMTPEARDQAYKDLAWRNGPLHMSAPCIYSEVMEGLELKPGLSFLNVGSGTGYLSTLVGLILGSNGINHGVEVHPIVVDYANKKLTQFLEGSPTMDEFDFCEPKFLCGNGLCLAPLQTAYDRVYCGAGCPEEYQNYFQQLIKVGGILIMPLNDNLLQVKRTGPTEWVTRSLLNVSFATLRVPSKEEQGEVIRLEEQTPARLQQLARSVIRECMRGAMRRRNPQLREPPPRAPPAKRACPRRICIPVDDDSDTDGLNALHDLDRASGANEMNALLSLVLSMGHNRVAQHLRVSDSPDSDSSYDPEHENEEQEDQDRISPTLRIVNVNDRAPRGEQADGGNARPNVRSVLMFEFRDRNGVVRHNPPLSLRRRNRNRNNHRRHRDPAAQIPVDIERELDNEMYFDAEGNDVSELVDGGSPARRRGRRTAGGPDDRLEEEPEDEEIESENGEDKLKDKKGVMDDDIKIDDKENKTDDIENKTNDKEVTIETKENKLKNQEIILEEDEDTEEKQIESEDKEVSSKEKESTSKDEQSTSQETVRSSKGSSKRKEKRSTPKHSSRASGSRGKDKVSKSRHRSSKSTRRSSGEKKEDKPNPEVPTEVEICLGKASETSEASEKAGPSTMEWETSDTVEDEAKAASSEDETSEMLKAKEEKRQKLDSGIGEENSPSGGSASHRSGERDPSHTSDSCDSDRSDYDEVRGRRVRQKRGHLSTRSSSSTAGSEELERDSEGEYHARRPRKPRTDHHAARRAALSLLMKQGVQELPLPLALQRFVNLGRSFDF